MGSTIDSGDRVPSPAFPDPARIRSLYVEHAPDLYGYFSRRVGRDLAEDLLAETFQAAIDSYAGFDAGRGTERAWLFGIGSNLLRRHWRTEHRRLRALALDAAARPTAFDPLVAVGDHVAHTLDARRQAQRLVDALAALDADDRTLLFLSGWEHMNSREIGDVLGMPAVTVRSRLKRLRDHLRHHLGDVADASREDR